MKDQIILTAEELGKIQYIVEHCQVDTVKLMGDTSSGIGKYLKATFDTTVNGINGSFTVDITNHSNW